jgi:hypothetical protein
VEALFKDSDVLFVSHRMLDLLQISSQLTKRYRSFICRVHL